MENRTLHAFFPLPSTNDHFHSFLFFSFLFFAQFFRFLSALQNVHVSILKCLKKVLEKSSFSSALIASSLTSLLKINAINFFSLRKYLLAWKTYSSALAHSHFILRFLRIIFLFFLPYLNQSSSVGMFFTSHSTHSSSHCLSPSVFLFCTSIAHTYNINAFHYSVRQILIFLMKTRKENSNHRALEKQKTKTGKKSCARTYTSRKVFINILKRVENTSA